MAAATGHNTSVEDILASIRKAISQDDANRTNDRARSEPRSLAEKKPVANVTSVFGDKDKKPVSEIEPTAVPATPEAEAAAVAENAADQEFIEQAIEQALDGVRAELEGSRATAKTSRVAQSQADAAAQRAGIRTTRIASLRTGATTRPPLRALMSPKTDAHVAASFEDLSKAMMGGNARKLDEVVEELLRPMLKGWLEGNLPQMVERLVREEIERVSRGPRG